MSTRSLTLFRSVQGVQKACVIWIPLLEANLEPSLKNDWLHFETLWAAMIIILFLFTVTLRRAEKGCVPPWFWRVSWIFYDIIFDYWIFLLLLILIDVRYLSYLMIIIGLIHFITYLNLIELIIISLRFIK